MDTRTFHPIKACDTCGGSLVVLRDRQVWIFYENKAFRIPQSARLPEGLLCPRCARRIKDETPSRKGQWTPQVKAAAAAKRSKKTKGIPKPQANSPTKEIMEQANSLYSTGRYTQREIGIMFGVDASTMSRRLDPFMKPKRGRRTAVGNAEHPYLDDRTWYIYALVDPRTKEPRYAGWTVDPDYRLRRHITEARRFNKNKDTHKSRWIRSLLCEFVQPELLVLEQGKGDGWQAAERHWIAKLRGEGRALTNITEGGQGGWGVKHSPQSREKIAASKRGIPLSKEHRTRLIEAGRRWAKDNVHPMKGRKFPEETRRKISAGLRSRFAKIPYTRKKAGCSDAA